MFVLVGASKIHLTSRLSRPFFRRFFFFCRIFFCLNIRYSLFLFCQNRELGKSSAENRKSLPSSKKNMFYKTKQDLTHHIEQHSNWTPSDETFSAEFTGLHANSYYEICLAVIDHSTVYYLHRDHCQEVRMPQGENESRSSLLGGNSPAAFESDDIENNLLILPAPSPVSLSSSVIQGILTSNVSFVPDVSSITVTWQVQQLEDVEHQEKDLFNEDLEVVSLIRRISLRYFGNDTLTQLYVIEDFNRSNPEENGNLSSRYYTLPFLQPATPYVICFDTLLDEEKENPLILEPNNSNLYCREVSTLSALSASSSPSSDEAALFPMAEIVTATAVSASTTVIIVALLCCCCFPGFCGKKKRKKEKQCQNGGALGQEGDKKFQSEMIQEEKARDENGNVNEIKTEEEHQHRQQQQVKLSSTEMIIPEDTDEELDVDDDDIDRSTRIDMAHSDDDDAEINSQHYRSSSIISVIENAATNKESIFQERYSTATLPRSEGEENDDNIGNKMHQQVIEVNGSCSEPAASTADPAAGAGSYSSPAAEAAPPSSKTSAARRRRFWKACLSPNSASANSSLYSQYDYTVHSEATTAPPGGGSNSLPPMSSSTTEEDDDLTTTSEDAKTEAETAFHTQHNSHSQRLLHTPPPQHHFHHGHGHRHHHHHHHHHHPKVGGGPLSPPLSEPAMHHDRTGTGKRSLKSSGKKGGGSKSLAASRVDVSKNESEKAFAETQKYLKKNNHLLQMGSPPFHVNDHKRRSRSGPTSPNNTLNTNNHSGHHFGGSGYPHMHSTAHNSLAAMGPGNYHTISHYQFYKRPVPTAPPVPATYVPHHQYYSPAPQPEYYHHNPHPHHHGHHPLFSPPGAASIVARDYAKTLGRTRRESPMAMVPIPHHHGHHHHPLISPPVVSQLHHHPQPTHFELKPFSLKRLKNKSKGILPGLSSGGQPQQPQQSAAAPSDGNNYKMYTWSPYSTSLFYAEGTIKTTPEYPYRLKEPTFVAGGKSMEELRF